jgi:Transposase DDE domain
METPLLYRQLQDQLSQWVQPKDQRHLQGFAEIVAAVLQSGEACLGRWIPYLSHRDCGARAHMERLSYFLHNPQITAERYYEPILRQALSAFAGETILLTLDTSMLWDRFCLIEVCFVWGGRSFTLAQVVLEHGSATVSFAQYEPVLERARTVLPPAVQVTLLADRGFEHGELMRWLTHQQWDWAIRVKSDLLVTTPNGRTRAVEGFFPPPQQAYLVGPVQVLGNIDAHLATANVPGAQDTWAVLSSQAVSLQTFALYGQRFGGIEPHFKDYKSAALGVLDSGLREADGLTRLFMLLDCAYLIALVVGMMLVKAGQRTRLDWHANRGLSFLQLGLRELARLCYERLPLPILQALPKGNPPPACASQAKQDALACRIEFSKVVTFSY